MAIGQIARSSAHHAQRICSPAMLAAIAGTMNRPVPSRVVDICPMPPSSVISCFNCDISDKESLENILENCSIEKNTFFKEIENQKIKDKLKELTKNAFKKDIFGAPTFVVNDKIFWGQDRLDYALEEYNS